MSLFQALGSGRGPGTKTWQHQLYGSFLLFQDVLAVTPVGFWPGNHLLWETVPCTAESFGTVTADIRTAAFLHLTLISPEMIKMSLVAAGCYKGPHHS